MVSLKKDFVMVTPAEARSICQNVDTIQKQLEAIDESIRKAASTGWMTIDVAVDKEYSRTIIGNLRALGFGIVFDKKNCIVTIGW